MSTLQRVRLLSNERLDIPDFQNLTAFANADWTQFFRKIVSTTPLIVQGFEIQNPDLKVNTKLTTIPIHVAGAIMTHPSSVGAAAGFFVGDPGASDQNVALTANVVNYIEVDQTTVTGAPDTRAFWDEVGGASGTGAEFTKTVDTVTYLDVVISVNTTGFSAGKVPIAKVTTDSTGIITAITDCRPMFFRLGSGGTAPDPLHKFSWPGGRVDHSVTMTGGSSNPFQGSDKSITSLKNWMDAVMTRIAEIQGSSYWFDTTGAASGSISNLYRDTVGQFLNSTGNVRFGVAGANIFDWTSTLTVNSLAGPYNFTIAAGSATLDADGKVAYLTQAREVDGPHQLDWVNGASFVNDGPDGVGSFTGLVVGDWIKNNIDPTSNYVQIAAFKDAANGGGAGTTAAAAVSVTTTTAYLGSTTTGVYQSAKGVYTISVATAVSLPNNANIWWLAARWGGKVYTRDGFEALASGETRPFGRAEVVPDYTSSISGAVQAPNWQTTNNESLVVRTAKLTGAVASASQDKNIMLICKTNPAFTWTSGSSTLAWNDLYLVTTGDDELRNKIDASSNTLADQDVLYVTMNRDAGANTSLTVTKTTASALNPLTLNDQVVVIARRIGTKIYTRNIFNNTSDITANDVVVHDVKPTNQVAFSGGHYLDDNRADLYYRGWNATKVYTANFSGGPTTSSTYSTEGTVTYTVPTGFTAVVTAAFWASWRSDTVHTTGLTGEISLKIDTTATASNTTMTDIASFVTTYQPIYLGFIDTVGAGTYDVRLKLKSSDNASSIDFTGGFLIVTVNLSIP